MEQHSAGNSLLTPRAGAGGLADEMSIRILAGTTTTHRWAMEKEAGASTA
jgi:hypothetical protein